MTLLSGVGAHLPSPALIAGEIAWQLAAGAAIGVLAGVAGALALRRVALSASGLYPIAILALIVASYGAATVARASGFLAVYVSALVLGNARLPHGPAIRGFAEGVAWLAQIGLFVMLGLPGLLASPARLPAQIIPAIAAGSVLVLAARPAAVPIVLATIPMNARVPGATRLFDVVFIIVVINTLAQGPTLPWAARRLKVTAPAEPLDVDVEAAPLEALHADLLQAQIPAGSRLHGVEIFELRLPSQANIALIVRDGKGFVPSPTTTLRTGVPVTPSGWPEGEPRSLADTLHRRSGHVDVRTAQIPISRHRRWCVAIVRPPAGQHGSSQERACSPGRSGGARYGLCKGLRENNP